MVCFVSDSLKPEDNNSIEKIIDITMDSHDNEDLTVQRIAGGSVIEYPPIFSPNGDILFIIWDSNIQAYSTSTGEWIRDLEGIPDKQLIGQQCDPNNQKLLYGCTKSGDIISWKWKSGVVNEKETLKFVGSAKSVVSSFSLIHMKDKQAYGLVSWQGKNLKVQIGIFDLSTGIQLELPLPVNLTSLPIKMSVGQNEMYFFALIQNEKLHCVNYLEGKTKTWKNAKNQLLTCVTCHPNEQVVATGDVTGKIFLYREIFKNIEPLTTLYHWHHTGVNALTFTLSGSHFYSGGSENTLVRWNINAGVPSDFLPRMWGNPLHIVVGADNQKVAVAADDNGIQILNAQNNPTAIIQNFTWIPNDKTDIPKFPIGLKINPRTSSLVLNGRIGHLQFYSTHTKNLLFNLDTTTQNRLNIETEKVLYNTYVSHATLNMDWLATAELLDDHEHTLESRIKFWQFDVEKQTYVLNTQIELPHENGVRDLEFSTPYSMENLLCASCGEFDVKIWSLEDSDSIYRKGKFWSCIGRTTYKNLPIKSLSFSPDTSLLSVGFGNTLCVYTSETLRLKCVLSAPSGLDGSTNKLTITLPSNKDKTSLAQKRNQFLEKRKKMLTLIKNLLEKNDTSIIKNVEKKANVKTEETPRKKQKLNKLSLDEQELIFNQIIASNSIDLFQKINIFDKFNLHVRTPAKVQQSLNQYCNENHVQEISSKILRQIYNLSVRHKFVASHKYNQYKLRNSTPKNVFTSLKRIVSFKQPNTNHVGLITNGRADSEKSKSQTTSLSEEHVAQQINSTKCCVQINHVAFCTAEYAHLVIVCTDKRLLIWNLLTLRLQSSYKLSVSKISIDLYTSLVAAFTHNNDLYVFLPNTPIPLYQRKNLPKVHGLAWIPRRHPKNRSLTVDWQTSTELYFLSEKQELFRLVSRYDMESFPTNATYLSDNLQPLPYTPFAAMIAKQQNNYATSTDKDNRTTDTYSIGVLGKNSVKELTGLQTHTMAPVSLLCTRFLKSLLIDDEKIKRNAAKNENDDNDAEVDGDDEDVRMNSDDE